MKPKSILLVAAVAALAGCGGAQVPPPAAPSELRGVPMGEGLHLYWKDNSADEEEFVIEGQVEAGPFTELGRVPFNTTQYMVQEGEPGRRYGFRVVARNVEGASTPSNEVTWTP